MISYSEAVEIVRSRLVRQTPVETVPLVLSLGRFLAEPIVAEEAIPPFNNSAMDGYAVRAADTVSADRTRPKRLRVIGEVAAGSIYDGSIGEGEAVRIMTGGPVPSGADAIVEVEGTEESEDGEHVDVFVQAGTGRSIRLAGEDIPVGQMVLPAGRRVQPTDIGLLASLGITNVPVRVKPKVGILTTGNEVIEPHRRPQGGEIRNSSGPALFAAVMQAGGEPIDLGIVGDDEDDLNDALEHGLRFDILITTGGVSAGKYDLVQHLLPANDVEILFHRVNIRPGKPVLFGVGGDDPHAPLVFGLPGNPVSSMITFRQFVLPAIRHFLGTEEDRRTDRGTFCGSIAKEDSKRHFIRGIIKHDREGSATVRTTGTQSSGALSSMSIANCLIILDETSVGVADGDVVVVERID